MNVSDSKIECDKKLHFLEEILKVKIRRVFNTLLKKQFSFSCFLLESIP